MSTWLGLIQQVLFFGGVVVALSASATALAYPFAKSRLQLLRADVQASIMLGLFAAMLAVLIAHDVLHDWLEHVLHLLVHE